MRGIVILSLSLTLAGCGISAEERLKGEAEGAVRELLRDPESARFDYGPIAMVFPEQGLVCAEVNSRNGFGGYAGKQMFAYASNAGAFLIRSDLAGFTRIQQRCLAASAARTQAISDRTNAMYEADPTLRAKVEAQTRNETAR